MTLLVRQIWTLITKNLLITLVRHPLSTPFRAFLLPCIFIAFLSYARNLFIPASVYGIGEPHSVRSLPEAISAVSGGRNKLVFVNNGYSTGEISNVITAVTEPLGTTGVDILVLDQEAELLTTCQNSIRGTSSCIAAAVFYSSPNEGPSGRWNYSIRADGDLGFKIVTNRNDNDAEIYILPLQHAIDYEIARLNTTGGNVLASTVTNYPYTSMTQEQRRENIRIRYMGGIIDILAVAFFIAMVGVSYQLTGLIATEREIGMAQLLDCMMPNRKRWLPQMLRIVSNHLALDLVYGPGWVVIGIILGVGVFTQTSMAINIVFNVLSGLAMSSLSIFGAGFFRKAQLSGITVVIVSLLIAIAAQVAGKASTGTVAILSLLFPPMNYVYFTILMARWERQNLATNMVQPAPQNPSTLPGIAFWIFSIIQIIAFPIIGAIVEKALYGTASKDRKTYVANTSTAVELNGFTREYKPDMFRKTTALFSRAPINPVVAVNDLNLTAIRGEIMVLLGANGSGKSTTLDAIAGLSSISSGGIAVNYPDQHGGLGLCPQKNVLWDNLTVTEHVRIFNRLKSSSTVSTKNELEHLLSSCDINRKAKAQSRTLSGGQKRKLQLAMMFTGGSSVCCIDEVSSGLDPLSRRKIWDILLAERGRRSIILTTHFLDEADLLADHIAILSKGVLKATGTSVELKHNLGSGYRVHVYHMSGVMIPVYQDMQFTQHDEQVTYFVATSAQAAQFLTRLEADGITEYQVSGPTIEDVFLKLADEANTSDTLVMGRETNTVKTSNDGDGKTAVVEMRNVRTHEVPELLTGTKIGMPRQAAVLFSKRFVVFRRNSLPYVAAFLIPIVAAGLVTLFLKSFTLPGCTPDASIYISEIESLSSQINYELLAGPASSLSSQAVSQLAQTFSGLTGGGNAEANTTRLLQSLTTVDTLSQFNAYIDARFANVTPGGVFLSDVPVFAWRGDGAVSYAVIMQNVLDNLITNIPISTQYQAFDIPFGPDTGKALQLITYFGLAMSVYPAFFALYPNVERLRNVRGLHYSNGVRSMPLWLAYTAFDFVIVLLVSVIAIIIFRAATAIWYNIGYLFVVLFLYGLASTLLSYVVSLFSRSQLSAFAFAAAGQAVMFLLYFIAFMTILTYVDAAEQNSALLIAHFTISTISPICNLTRSLFVALNVFSVTCKNRELETYPGAITAYGGPILYLIFQSFFLFGLLLWWDSGPLFRRFRKKSKEQEVEDKISIDQEVSNELTRVTSSCDGLRVLNLTKQFKHNLAVDDVTFGVPRGEVFALLGPNGAGKSTCISLIRGDIQPSRRGGDIFVDEISVISNRAQARSRLGVCPQFDAMDTMTVREHLHFYAKIRGISRPQHNVQAVMQAVGLQEYAERMAAKLSGGNKRKLSLGIALMGNPSVLLLDEPSSGMDAASKRVMWKTLASVVPGRSLVLTTHSMEEADALASRAGIMASKMLALGTTDYLRRKHGDAYYVHLVHNKAPHTPEGEMNAIRDWARAHFPGAEVDNNTYHGQLRFAVPTGSKETTTSRLFAALEQQKAALGIEYYSVSRATLDQVFLSIVGKHNIEEEGESDRGTQKNWRRLRRCFGSVSKSP